MRAVLVVISALLAMSTGLPHYRGSPKPRLDGRIIGGQSANIENFPYQVSLLYFGSHICGGATISARIIATAAHCTDGLFTQFMSIRAGSSIVNAGGVVVPVSSVIQHPLYNWETVDFDLSLLNVAQTLNFGTGISAVGLPYLNQEFAAGLVSNVSGWGYTVEGAGVLSPDLQVISVPLDSTDACRAAYGFDAITERMICAGVLEGGLDACQGDSGGPLTVDGPGGPILVGLVSWGYRCALPGFPGVYARISAFRDFIAIQGWV